MPPEIKLQLSCQGPLHFGLLSPAEELNGRILRAFQREQQGPACRRSHLEAGRFENTYIERTAIPEIEPLYAHLLQSARQILKHSELKSGFWFNAMQPGERTLRHNHEEEDEQLSCVYYVLASEDCGDLLVHARPQSLRVRPQAGQCVFFSPRLAHEVEVNRSNELRLSVAFNFGTAN